MKKGSLAVRAPQLRWPLVRFDTLPHTRRYHVRHLRYWFVYHLLHQHYQRLRRPLRVLEVGIADGRMLTFMNGAPWIKAWHGMDVQATPEVQERYDRYVEADVEGSYELAERYEAVVVLHVLEHLFEPEKALSRLCAFVNRGGVIIGGSPTMPSLAASIHTPWLRKKNGGLKVTDHRHLSVITPRRISSYARTQSLSVDFLSGAFLCRWSDAALEDTAAWIRANLAWGAAFPSLGGEVYFMLQRQD